MVIEIFVKHPRGELELNDLELERRPTVLYRTVLYLLATSCSMQYTRCPMVYRYQYPKSVLWATAFVVYEVPVPGSSNAPGRMEHGEPAALLQLKF